MDHRFSPAQAIWDNRQRLSEVLPEMRNIRSALQTVMGGPRDFLQQQWLQLISLVYAFKPDLILELGRGYGNSTCAMALATKMLRPQLCRMMSFCLSDAFTAESRPHLDSHLDDGTLFFSLDALTCDVSTYDFSPAVREAERVFIFWDVHGYDLALSLLSGLFRTLVEKPHLAIVHDMADLKYMGERYRSYDSDSLWLQFGTAAPKHILGDVGAQYDEAVALVDFLGRNHLPFWSAESFYFPELSDAQRAELTLRFGADFSPYGFWYSFSVNSERDNPLTFPPAPG